MDTQEPLAMNSLRAMLLSADRKLNPKVVYQLSDLTRAELDELAKYWAEIPTWRRQALCEEMARLADEDDLLSFDAAGRLALKDEDARVRNSAVVILRESEEIQDFELFLVTLKEDSSPQVRASAAGALGTFVYLGELEEITPLLLHRAEEALFAAYRQDGSPEVQRSALESLGFSSRQEVPAILRVRVQAAEVEWVISAILAIGRSANASWTATILDKLDDRDDRVRLAATRAAGELEARGCRERLFELVEDDDREVQLAALWSLSQIGGEGIQSLIQIQLEQTEDEDEIEFLQDALDNLNFTNEVELLDLLELEDGDDLELDEEDLDADALD